MNFQDLVIRYTMGNLYWKDLEGRYLGCNDTLANMIGLSLDEIVGKSDRDLFLETLGDNYLKVIESIDREVMSSGVQKTIEEVGVNKKGELAYYMTVKRALKDENGKVIGLVGNSVDITKQKQAEVVKSEFLRNMSHDIMVPFTGILGISRLLHDDEKDEKKKKNLSYLVKSGDRLLQLLKQILEMTELGNQQIIKTTFNVKEMVNEAVEMVASAVELKGLTLFTECPDVMIESDRVRLTRILTNLVSNAVKFTEKGSIKIVVKTEPVFSMTVEDTGIGIPQDKLEVIFDEFQKLSESSKHSQFMGAGIGLYIVKQFATDLNGKITVESQLGAGSRFTFIC